jgi:hypothetical protein
MTIEDTAMSRWDTWERLLKDIGRASAHIAESRVGLFDGVRGAAYSGCTYGRGPRFAPDRLDLGA